MTSSNQKGGASTLVPAQADAALVKRSDVPKDLQYHEYKKYLRYDFFYSCAYCTMAETEAQAIRFVIDHYEPRKARPELVHEYANLMYSCDECNVRKGDRCPPPEARKDDHRFFRPDRDVYQEHFQKSGIRLESQSNVGEYSIAALDLNRHSLRRLRNIRERLTKCDRFVAEGVLGLRRFHIDQLPPGIKGSANRAIKEAVSVANQMAEDIDTLLRDRAHSELVDPDPESESRAQQRAAKLKGLEVLYPGSWRASRKSRR